MKILLYKIRQAMLLPLITVIIGGCSEFDSGKPMNPDIIFRDLKSADASVRQEAVKGLVSMAITPDGAQAIEKRLKFLAQIIQDKEEHAEIRAQTMRAIALASERVRINQEIVPALIRLLLDENENARVRSWIAMSLPDLAPPEFAGPAVLAATRSKNAAVRTNASQQVPRLSLDPDKVLRWLQNSIDDTQGSVRLAAVSAAAATVKHDKRALAILLRGATDKDRLVRQAVVQILTDEEVLDSTAKKDVIAAIEKMLNDPSPAVSMNAAVVLLRMLPDRAATQIMFLNRGLEANDAKRREAAAEALTLVGVEGSAAVPTLEKAIRDPNDRVKVHAAMALIQITKKKDPYAKLVRELAQSSDPQVMMWAKVYEATLISEAEESKEKEDPKQK